MTVLKSVTVTFARDGAVEYAVMYAHTEEPPTPGIKTRTTRMAQMAANGLRDALAHLKEGALVWGGFATNTRESTDELVADRKERAA
jgi:hypothetical protein